MQQAGDILGDILARAKGMANQAPFQEVLDDLLGPHAEHCRVISFRGGKLLVEVDSVPLHAELAGLRREELRLAINERLPDRKVARLNFRVGGTIDA